MTFNIHITNRAISPPSQQAIAKNQHEMRLWVAPVVRCTKY
jgi:hypothetical protein